MEKLIEKQYFYVSEFKQEGAWLSFMHREGWKFVSTTGTKYEFEKCEKEDYVYELDFKEDGIADEDYIQMFSDYGWEYVFQYQKWFYFRKKRTQEEEDMSIFSDNESKIDLCKRILKEQSLRILPLYCLLLVLDYIILFTPLAKGNTFFHGLAYGIVLGSILVIIFRFGIFIGQYSRLNKMIKDSELH